MKLPDVFNTTCLGKMHFGVCNLTNTSCVRCGFTEFLKNEHHSLLDRIIKRIIVTELENTRNVSGKTL